MTESQTLSMNEQTSEVIEDDELLNNLADKLAEETKGHRRLPRYAVPWRIFLIYKKKGKREIFRGVIADLSLGVASFYSEVNIHSAEPIVVTIEIPSYLRRKKNIIVGAKCRILRSVLSSGNYGMFHILLKFIEFDRGGQRELTDALSGRVALGEYKAPYA